MTAADVAEEEEASTTACTECGCEYEADRPTCPRCGWEPNADPLKKREAC